MRRPPETDLFPRGLKRLRSGNHDAFNSRCSYVGPTLDRCTFQYHCDDCVNISGFYAFVTEQKGRTLRIAPYGGTLRIDPGDTCQLMTFEGICLPDAQIVSVKPAGATTAAERKMFESYNLWPGIAAGVQRAFEVELDADRVLPPGSVIISNRRMGNGFRIRNCTMGHNRARGLLIKASDGVIESNLIERVEGWAVQIAPEYDIRTVGVGDGGNEIGMGNVADIIEKELSLVPCVVKVDYLVIASVSNWGAYGLAAYLSIMEGKHLMPTYVWAAQYMKETVEIGSVDGITHERVTHVDGFDESVEQEILDALTDKIDVELAESAAAV